MHTTALRLRVWRRMRPVILRNFGLFLCFSFIHLLSKDSVTVFFYVHKTPFERQLIQQALQKYLLFHTKRHLEERQELNIKPSFKWQQQTNFKVNYQSLSNRLMTDFEHKFSSWFWQKTIRKTFGFFVDSYLAQKHTLSSLKMVLLGSVKTWPLSSRNRTQLGSVFRAKLSTFSQLPSPVAVGFCWLNLKTKGLTLTGEPQISANMLRFRWKKNK